MAPPRRPELQPGPDVETPPFVCACWRSRHSIAGERMDRGGRRRRLWPRPTPATRPCPLSTRRLPGAHADIRSERSVLPQGTSHAGFTTLQRTPRRDARRRCQVGGLTLLPRWAAPRRRSQGTDPPPHPRLGQRPALLGTNDHAPPFAAARWRAASQVHGRNTALEPAHCTDYRPTMLQHTQRQGVGRQARGSATSMGQGCRLMAGTRVPASGRAIAPRSERRAGGRCGAWRAPASHRSEVVMPCAFNARPRPDRARRDNILSRLCWRSPQSSTRSLGVARRPAPWVSFGMGSAQALSSAAWVAARYDHSCQALVVGRRAHAPQSGVREQGVLIFLRGCMRADVSPTLRIGCSGSLLAA